MVAKNTEASILIVDDDKATIDMLSMLLKKNGYEVGTALNGREAIAFLKKKTYDVIITDLKMPDLDGYQLLEIVRTSYRGHKVMVMTADLFKKDRLLRKGAMEALAKPFNLKVLIDELSVLLKERRRTKRFTSKKQLRCLVKDKASDYTIQGEVIDISIDGSLINVDKRVTPMSEIEIDLYAPDQQAIIGTVAGQVVRISPLADNITAQIAMYFNDERDMALLEKLGNAIHLKNVPAGAAG